MKNLFSQDEDEEPQHQSKKTKSKMA